MSIYKFLLVSEPKQGIQVITFNRPKQGNSFPLDMYPEVTSALAVAAKDDRVKAVVVTGAGPFFSSGADVMEAVERNMAGEEEEILKDIPLKPIKLTTAMIDFPKLVVAAVNGPVVGYPAGLLGLFDLVFVSEKATMKTPFMHLGLVTEGCSSAALVAAVGHQTYMRWLTTNKAVPAQEMVQSGLAAEVYPAENFLDNVLRDLVANIKTVPASSIFASKALMRSPIVREAYHKANEKECELLLKQFKAGVPAKQFQKVFEEMQAKKASRKGSKSKL